MALVAALAGRRIDDPASPGRFPLENMALVAARLEEQLTARDVTALVCSAACGADLLALDAAARLGLRRRIVLPFAAGTFRDQSVTDRPGDWGPLFDRMVAEVRAVDDLVILDEQVGTEGYLAASLRILDEAEGLAATLGCGTVAIVVWEGQARPGTDMTDAFRAAATLRGIAVVQVLTR